MWTACNSSHDLLFESAWVLHAASLGMALASLIEAKGTELESRNVLMYSYGSGLAASMFILKGKARAGAFNLKQLQSKVSFLLLCKQVKITGSNAVAEIA